MKLYHAYRDDWGWDCVSGFVIRAESEKQARAIAAANSGDEGASTWTDPEVSKCEILRPDGESGIIMRDFHAG